MKLVLSKREPTGEERERDNILPTEKWEAHWIVTADSYLCQFVRFIQIRITDILPNPTRGIGLSHTTKTKRALVCCNSTV